MIVQLIAKGIGLLPAIVPLGAVLVNKNGCGIQHYLIKMEVKTVHQDLGMKNHLVHLLKVIPLQVKLELESWKMFSMMIIEPNDVC